MNKLGTNYRQSHYGHCMNPTVMREWGPRIAASVEAIIAEGKFPILVYRGMSGVAAANTIANFMTSQHGTHYAMMYVRKKNEKSHGQRIEYTTRHQGDREIVWVFCDDFISKGKTMLDVVKTVSRYFDIEIPFNSIRYALVLEGARWEESYNVNNLHDALCNQFGARTMIAKRIRKNYSAFVRQQRKERAEREEKIRAANASFRASLGGADPAEVFGKYYTSSR